MKRLTLSIFVFMTVGFVYAQSDEPIQPEVKYDYITVQSNLNNKAVILNNGEKNVLEYEGKTFNIVTEIDLIIENLQKQGFEFVQCYVIDVIGLQILLRKKVK